MGAIAKHNTAVNKTRNWDGSKAITEAKNDEAVLRYMHAWINEKADPLKKSSYRFAHHDPGMNTPAIIEAVNQALVRLCQENIPDKDKLIVEAHLRQHRVDAGLNESMSVAEASKAIKFIKEMDDLNAQEAKVLSEAVILQEKYNLAEWLESRLHLSLTVMADDMFGGGIVSRNERKVLSGAIGAALDSYHEFIKENAPQLFQRRPWEEAPEDDDQDISEAKLKEVLLDESAIALQEKAVRSDGTVQLKIIEPGWGSSGFYPVEVLKRDGAKAFPKGTKMNWNHPTSTEEAERPEGDLNFLASELVSDARWMERGPKGAGLYADAKVFEAYQPAVNDLAPHIGVSIHARGKAMQGEADGQQGVIVQEILESPFNRVDYVTMPGAGGEIVSLFEAVRAVRTDKDKPTAGTVPAAGATDVAKEDSDLEEAMKIEELQEKVATLETNNQTLATNNARLNERMAIRDAQDMVKEALQAISLPDITKARLIESLSLKGTLPLKDGLLDKETFKKTIDEAVKAESKYLESVLGKGEIRGLGESLSDNEEGDDETKVEASLEESFKTLGLSEAGAKIAAKGRG
jgi:hypothetical protein